MRGNFRLDNGNSLVDCYSPSWVNPPTSLNHFPQTIRELGMVGFGWPASSPHGNDRRTSHLTGKWDLSSKRLTAKYSIQRIIKTLS